MKKIKIKIKNFLLLLKYNLLFKDVYCKTCKTKISSNEEKIFVYELGYCLQCDHNSYDDWNAENLVIERKE